jgi:Secretion system C-terminal sorting domain
MKKNILFLIFALVFSNLHGQGIPNGTKFLSFAYSYGSTSDREIDIDSIVVTKMTTDTTLFYIQGVTDKEFYEKRNNKIYQIKGTQNLLLYDYSLIKGDTFNIKGIRFDVDSIQNILMLDNKYYKHWYLSSKFFNSKTIWIENLGDKNNGWSYYTYLMIPDVSKKLSIICNNDTLIYRTDEIKNNANLCDFENLKKLLFIPGPTDIEIQLAPNPTDNYLYFDVYTNDTKFIIYNNLGQPVRQGILESKLDVSSLANGIYYINFNTNGINYHGKFCKQ